MGQGHWDRLLVGTVAVFVVVGTMALVVTFISVAQEYTEKIEKIRQEVAQVHCKRLQHDDAVYQKLTSEIVNDEVHRPDEMSQPPHHSNLKQDRKRSVDPLRDESTVRFQQAFALQISQMQEQITRFIQEQIAFCQDIRTSLGNQLMQKMDALDDMGEQLATLMKGHSEGIFQLETTLAQKVQDGQQWSQQRLQASRSECDAQTAKLHNFLTEMFLPPSQALSRHLATLSSHLQSQQQQLDQQIKNHLSTMETHNHRQQQAIDKLQQLMDGLVRSQLDEVRQMKKRHQILLQERSSYQHEVRFQLNKLSSALVSLKLQHQNWDRRSNHSYEELGQSLDRLMNRAQTTHQATQVEKRSTKQRQTDLKAHINKVSKSLQHGVDNATGEVLSTIEEAADQWQQVQTSTKALIESSATAWQHQHAATEEQFRLFVDKDATHLRSCLEKTQGIQGGVRSGLESQEAWAEGQRTKWGTWIKNNQEEMDARCSAVAKWGADLGQQLHDREAHLHAFLQSKSDENNTFEQENSTEKRRESKKRNDRWQKRYTSSKTRRTG